MRYVAYYRVSTKKQGLGLDAQKAAVKQFIDNERNNGREAEPLKWFEEKESGKDDHRPELEKALAMCKRENAVLLLAKLDRLSRKVSFIFALKESAVRFRALDMPEVQDVLTLAIYAGLAEQERQLISMRTKAALQALKAKGVKLGTNNLTAEGRQKAGETMKRKAEENVNNIKAAAQAKKLKAEGMSLGQIANYLNAQGFLSARGGKFYKSSVSNLLKR